MLRAGLSQSEVARKIGAHRQSVSRWGRELEESGLRGLRKTKRTGPAAQAQCGPATLVRNDSLVVQNGFEPPVPVISGASGRFLPVSVSPSAPIRAAEPDRKTTGF